MTASLACQASDTFAGFGPVAADFYLPPICAHARARPIIIFHGTADAVVPYDGGHVSAPTRSPVGGGGDDGGRVGGAQRLHAGPDPHATQLARSCASAGAAARRRS